jgi:hypothetical protein
LQNDSALSGANTKEINEYTGGLSVPVRPVPPFRAGVMRALVRREPPNQ